MKVFIKMETIDAEEMASLAAVTYDADLCGVGNRLEGYERSIPVNEEEGDQDAGEGVHGAGVGAEGFAERNGRWQGP